MTPILLLGAGRMGGAMVAGWQGAGAFTGADLIIREPSPGVEVMEAEAQGALVNPPAGELRRAKTVVLAVKPQIWRDVAAELDGLLARDAVIVSIAAGVQTAAIAEAFGGRAVARVMPTTAAAIGRGTATIYADDTAARERAWALFEPLGAVVNVGHEDQMHAATAVSGSAPAYLYAFIEALEAAGLACGLPAEAASTLARSTITGAAALLAQIGDDPAELRRQVASPGGTTEAALKVLMGEGGLGPLLERAAKAAVARSKELGA